MKKTKETQRRNYAYCTSNNNYNSSKYIRDAIESIENQTYTNYEAIFIDDCSTDNSREIIEEYAKKIPKSR